MDQQQNVGRDQREARPKTKRCHVDGNILTIVWERVDGPLNVGATCFMVSDRRALDAAEWIREHGVALDHANMDRLLRNF
jgi:hypothetical protein